jgi:DNA polymerase III subunit gamma/tau
MTDQPSATPYRVLARKYRPQTFAELIGQEALVRTLTNAITTGRLAHAFLLTGVRGIGKTTTARILARALNCVGADGTGGPTAEPCGVCENCVAIAEDRHVDVLEMDAASRTGVDNIRELIEGVLYRPVQARYKIYIIDEVHMLSRSAFNALLKTLEEPPEHVKFIFATTEIGTIPVTVLSRCQRFDLPRVDAERLIAHFADIAAREEARLSEGALRLIARAADGSVRDGLSLLDQAIADRGGTDEISEAAMRDMLGLADGMQVFDLFEQVMQGDIGDALALLRRMYDAGADPVSLLGDLLGLAHWLTKIKVAPEAAADAVSDIERARGEKAAAALSIAVLARAWQMLLKGLEEARVAPHALQAVEMILVRLAYAALLPTPDEAIRALDRGDAPPALAPPRSSAPAGDGPAAIAGGHNEAAAGLAVAPRPTEPPPEPSPEAQAQAQTVPQDFAAVVALFADRREGVLYNALRNDVHLVHFEPGRIEFRAGAHAAPDLANRIGRLLGEWTRIRWMVSLSSAAGAPTLKDRDDAAAAARRAVALDHPLVKAALETFPGATVEDVRDVLPDAAPDAAHGIAAAADDPVAAGNDEEDPL